MEKREKPLRWIGSSRRDLQALPKMARRKIGSALWDAQEGRVSRYAKILHGFGGAAFLTFAPITKETLIVAFTQLVSVNSSMCCMCSRKNLEKEARRQPTQ